MKLLAGMMLFLLCGLAGERSARRLQRRRRTLTVLQDHIQQVRERQLTCLMSFREAVLSCPVSPEREGLLGLCGESREQLPLLTVEETKRLAAYARTESRSIATLRTERDALLTFLRQAKGRTGEELSTKGSVYRSVGYLLGAAALLLVL